MNEVQFIRETCARQPLMGILPETWRGNALLARLSKVLARAVKRISQYGPAPGTRTSTASSEERVVPALLPRHGRESMPPKQRYLSSMK
ncbi:hypothetical protein BH23GEM6_BH23GEM6_09350 [soil metagenome]